MLPTLFAALLLLLTTASFAAGAADLPKTAGLDVKDGRLGRVAVLRETFDAEPGDSRPEALGETLASAGYGVTYLQAADLADPKVLTHENFDCVVFPYGPRYPYEAKAAILNYLKTGGSFLSVGGYAFDKPMVTDSDGKWTAADTSEAKTPDDCLNTRKGRPGDTLGLRPDQIGAFDPSYLLKNVGYAQAAPDQAIVPSDLKIDGRLQGYAACAMLGSNSPVFPEKWGRWVPLVNAYDDSGRLRGAVGAMALNYAGPFKGSNWAFFGVTDTDLFAQGQPLLKCIPRIVGSLISGVYLHSPKTDLALYQPGETVRMSCAVANKGRNPANVTVKFRAFDRAGKEAYASPEIPVEVEGNGEKPVETDWRAPELRSDLYRVVVTLKDPSAPLRGEEASDVIETGFAARDESAAASGLHLNLKNNYFRDGDRPVLLSGTNHTGAIFYSANENPLVWDRDLAKMQENGLNILRVLHFSPFMAEKPGPSALNASGLALDKMPVKIERQLDALVQLCQKHKIVLFLSLHDWMPVELSDSELAAQRKFAKLIAERYKDVPGIMFDIQNEPSSREPGSPSDKTPPHVTEAWNRFLRGKYGTDDALRAAWKLSPPTAGIGKEPYCSGKDDWRDLRTLDAALFRQSLVDKWTAANAAGCKEGNPNAPVTVGYLQEYWALDKILSTGNLDFANQHSYNSIDVLRCDLKLFDRRFEGKSISLGEFGSVEDHNKRNNGEDIANEDFNRFLQTGHYVFGLGGSFLLNWCWKDMDDVVFPWGINHLCDGVRRDNLLAFRNQSLLFRFVRPKYESPEVVLVVPDSQMLGGGRGEITQALYRSVDALLGCHVDFGTIDDWSLDKLPASAKMLFYPVPYCPSDRVYEQLKSFVARGGTLYISGDISYDDRRERTRTNRLQELCGVRFLSEDYPNISVSENAKADWRTAEGIQVDPFEADVRSIAGVRVFTHGLSSQGGGSGRVYFTPVPIELGQAPVDLYSRILDEAHVARLPVRTRSAQVHVLRLPTEDGKTAYVMVNWSDESQEVTLSHRTAPDSLLLAPHGTGLAVYDASGKLTAVEAEGPVTVNGETVFDIDGHAAVISADGQDLQSARSLIVLPFGDSKVKITASGLKGAVVETGDVFDGQWRMLGSATVEPDGTVKCQGFDMAVVGDKKKLEHVGAEVAAELMLRNAGA